MSKRRKKKNNATTYVVSIFAIWIVAILFFTGVLKININNANNANNANPTTWNTKTQNKQYYANTIVFQTWTIIQIDYNIQWWYSHKIETKKDTFYAKSDKYNLNNFLNKDIIFSWEVIWFSPDDIPVLSITSIKTITLTNKNNDDTEKEKKYLSTKWIIIDLEWTDFQVKQVGENIYIYKNLSWSVATWEDFTWNNLSWNSFTWENMKSFVKISPYKCIEWSNLYDCNAFKQQAKIYKFNTTTNNNWVIFYKMPEINQYVVINENYGYNISPLTWDFFQFINYINIENLQSKKKQLIKNTCKNDKIELTQIFTMQNSWDKYDIIWFDTNSNKVLCKLTITWDVQMIWQLQSISYAKQILSPEVKIWNLDEKDYLVYESRGYAYKLYMPKSVKYSSEIINEDFWVSWLNCKQLVKIADWKTWNLDNPNVKVYYCKTNLSKEQIQWFLKNYMVIQNNWKTLILDVKQDKKSLEIASNIHIY